MGYRGQVYMEDEKVYLYTHWGASELEETVKEALTKGDRWGDPEYLGRIIFCQMVKGDVEGESGFGIGSDQYADIDKLVIVNCAEQMITVKKIYEDTEKSYTFKDFIKTGELK